MTPKQQTEESMKIMYEIYQDQSYSDQYHVVFFTELGEHDREREIRKAMDGRHVYDGFILESRKAEAKSIINNFVDQLNSGDEPKIDDLETSLEGLSV